MDAEEHPEEQPYITWHEAPVPPGMPVTQAYVWALDPDDGRVLIQDRGPQHPRRYTLPGGRPEPEDGGDPLKTAAREAMEESQIRIDTERAVYLGHQVVIRFAERPEPCAQLRYAAPIIAYEPIGPDPDNGRTNRRLMTGLERAPELLHWHETGAAQAKAALRAGEELGLPVDNPSPEGYRDGEKGRYLVCHDYGMGGLWWWVTARSAKEIMERVADVVVVTASETINRFAAGKLQEIDIDALDENPLTSLKTIRDEQRGQPGFGALVGRGTVYLRQAWKERDAENGETLYLMEIGEDGYRTRQVVEHADGRGMKTDGGDWPLNPPYDLYDPVLGRAEMDQAVFEAAWDKAEPETEG
jgi:8-oxo-dGTP pyrophosphatase MutT (NUDIX family)